MRTTGIKLALISTLLSDVNFFEKQNDATMSVGSNPEKKEDARLTSNANPLK